MSSNEKRDFLAFCFEIYKDYYGMNGKQVLEMFNQHGVINYILECSDALHTVGELYLIDDIDDFILHHPTEMSASNI